MRNMELRKATESAKKPRTLTLAEPDVRLFAKKLTLSKRVRISILNSTSAEVRDEIPHVARVIKTTAQNFCLQFENEDKTEMLFPDDAEIISISIISDIDGLPYFDWSSRKLEEVPTWFVSFDGGSAAGVGASSAAVHIKHNPTGQCFEIAKFHPSSTVNVVEHVAQIAAFRIAKFLPGTVAVMGDSKLAKQQMMKEIACRDTVLSDYLPTAQEAYIALDQNIVSYHLIPGHQGVRGALADNPADAVATRCKNRAADITLLAIHVAGIGMITLPPMDDIFEPIAEKQRRAPRGKALTTTPAQAAADAAAALPTQWKPATKEEYYMLRFFPARSEVPDGIRLQWNDLVKGQLKKIETAESDEAREVETMAFLALPNMWLPRNVSTARIVSHFAQQRPFALPSKEALPPVMKSKIQRLSEMVTQRAKDKNIKGALNVLQSETECSLEMNEEEKLEKLKTKFPQQLTAGLTFAIKDQNLPPISDVVMMKALRKGKKHAVPAIDGWTKMLLQSPCTDDSATLASVCVFMTQLLRGQFSPLVMHCIRAARLVGIPKPDGGIRPICVSHFFLKVVGAASLLLGDVRCKDWQYAIGRSGGPAEMIHKLMEHKRKGKTIMKLDQKNGYNTMPRALIESVLSAPHVSEYVKQFFRTVYYTPAEMVVFTSGRSWKTIAMPEGVRQGDATASFCYCIALDVVVTEIKQRASHEGIEIEDILIWMDDVSLVLDDPFHCFRVHQIAQETFAKYGMQLNSNSEKSAAMVMPNHPKLRGCEATVAAKEQETGFRLLVSNRFSFVIMGIDMADDNVTHAIGGFFDKYRDRTERFFALLERMDIHPAIVFTILRLCGTLRLKHVCSCLPDSSGRRGLVMHFDDSIIKLLNGPHLFDGHLQAPISELVYDQAGLGLPHYGRVAEELYQHAKLGITTRPRISKHGASATTDVVQLVPFNPHQSVERRAAVCANDWLFFTDAIHELTPAEFVASLHLRLRMCPATVAFPAICNCGNQALTQPEFIEHVYVCDKATRVGHTARHNGVVRALASVCRTYGITTTQEPRFYTYEDGSLNRPDVTFHTRVPIATDVTIVKSQYEVGVAAGNAAAEKVKKHDQAVKRMGHRFIPFAMEIYGHLDKGCEELFDTLSMELTPFTRGVFKRDMRHAVSVALARGKAQAVQSAIAVQRNKTVW